MVYALSLVHRIMEIHIRVNDKCVYCSEFNYGCLLSDPIMHEGMEYELFVSILMLSHKVNEDLAFHCKGWSKFSGLIDVDCTSYEKELLRVLGFDVIVRKELFDEWVIYICKMAEKMKFSEFNSKVLWSTAPEKRIS